MTRVRAVRNGVGCVTATAAAAAASARFCYSLEPSVGKQTVGIRVYGYVINVEAPRNRFDITRERGWTARTAHTSAPPPVGIPSARFPRGRIPGTSDDSHPAIDWLDPPMRTAFTTWTILEFYRYIDFLRAHIYSAKIHVSLYPDNIICACDLQHWQE